MQVGDTVDWGNGERVTLVDFEPGIFSATAVIETVVRDWSDGYAGRLVTRRAQTPLAVRFTHPRFFLRWVAFIPS